MTPQQLAPAYRLTLAGENITARLQGRLQSLTLIEKRGLEADELELVIDDSEGKLAIPRRGAVLELALGWQDQVLIEKGTYTVDDVDHSGTPDRLTVRARSADLRGGLRVKRERSWGNTTLGAVARKIAAAHGLTPVVEATLAGRAISHLDQTDESDVNLLTRVCKDHGALATIKSGRLLVVPLGKGQTASGKPLPPIVVTRQRGDKHSFKTSDRGTFKGVRAYWLNARTGKKSEVIVGDEDELKTLRHTYTSELEAARACEAEMGRMQRAAATFELTLAIGQPEAIPESPVVVSGWFPEVDDVSWICVQLTHTLDDSGLTTKVDTESLIAEGRADPDAAITGVRAWWLNKTTGKRSSVLVGKEGNVKTLPHVYVSEKNARAAAQREWGRLPRSAA